MPHDSRRRFNSNVWLHSCYVFYGNIKKRKNEAVLLLPWVNFKWCARYFNVGHITYRFSAKRRFFHIYIYIYIYAICPSIIQDSKHVMSNGTTLSSLVSITVYI